MNIVQIGTNTGDDHVRDFALKNNCDFILLVEPFDIHNPTIIKNYDKVKNYVIDNVAIDPNIVDDSVVSKTFYYAEGDGPASHVPGRSYEVSSLKPEHLQKHGFTTAQLETIEVNCISINYLFTKHNLSNIDYLFIDAEGYDLEILQSINFSEYTIKNIQIESLHLNKHALYEYMDDKNYSLINTKADYHGFDVMFRKV